MSKGQSQTGTQTGRTLGRCKSKAKAKSVVYVDVENGETHDVIVIDAPEDSSRSLLGSTKSPKELPTSTYINIDDDEIDGDGTENCDKGGGDHDFGGSSSKPSCPAFERPQSSQQANYGSFQFSRQKRSPLKFSKSRRTYSGKTIYQNRYGLSPSDDSSSSDSDSSDCELMEGSSGKIREQWERAASKKRMHESVLNDHLGLDDESSGSEPIRDRPKSAEGKNRTKQREETPFCTTSNDTNNEEENISSSAASGDATADIHFSTPEEYFRDHVAVDENSPSCSSPSGEETYISHKNADTHDGDGTFQGEHSISDTEVQSKRDDNNKPYNVTKETEATASSQFRCENVCVQEEGETVPAIWANYEEAAETRRQHEKTNVEGEAEFSHRAGKRGDTHISCEKVSSPDVDEMIRQGPRVSNLHSSTSSNNERANFNYKEKPFMREPSLWSEQPCGPMHVNNDPTFSSKNEKSFSRQHVCQNGRMEHEDEVIHRSVSHQETEKSIPVKIVPNFQNERDVNLQTACSTDEEEPALESNNIIQDPKDGNDAPADNNIIGVREKLKETDEYKRAAEEEWASRQRQLQIQAEEAQKLKKRKRAEAQRLLDMERRQKERVEEMRETQKKNAETIDLKEQLRVEVRKELDRLELIHNDMASLLRALGISVGSGFLPTSHEVNAAYKQALLKFHPDRASKTDIRQQVEAEEKFKLVSRLKEKLTNCATLKSKFY